MFSSLDLNGTTIAPPNAASKLFGVIDTFSSLVSLLTPETLLFCKEGSSTIVPSFNLIFPSGTAPVAVSAIPPTRFPAPSSIPNKLTPIPPSIAPISAPGGPPKAPPITPPAFIPALNDKYLVIPLVDAPMNA